MQTSSCWLMEKEERNFPSKASPNQIISYRIYSQPLRKLQNLKIKAEKKILSPIPESRVSPLSYLYTPMNKTFIYPKPRKLKPLELETEKEKSSKEKWAEKHFSCFQRFHYRSQSNQGEYQRNSNQRRTKIIKTCEISLQTY